jgi:putative ABC transport system substrate-binding protein
VDPSAPHDRCHTNGAIADVFGWRNAAEIGGLLSYGPDLVDLFTSGASNVDKIIRGAQPADLPIQQPTKFELVITLDTA